MPDDARSAAAARLKVWDPWVRLTHWAIVLLLPFSVWTAKTSRFDLHFISGFTILALVLFRIAWGFVGSETARFGNFLKGPGAALRHLGHLRDRAAPPEIGHNAAGGWMVLALLLLLLTQATTGLFADDEIFSRGPLARRVDTEWSAFATSIHLRAFWVILAFTALHVLAVLAHRLLSGRNLVKPMVTGMLEVPAGAGLRAPRMGRNLLAIALLAAVAALVLWIRALPQPSAFG
jgi:cytochrome b